MAQSIKGLRLKPTYEDLIGVAVSDELRNIKFPNRDASFLRNGFVLSQLDGEGQRVMERQQEMASKEAYKEHLLKEIAKNTGSNLHDLRNDAHHELRRDRVESLITTPTRPQTFDMTIDDYDDDGASFDTPLVSDYSSKINRILNFEEEEEIETKNIQENKREQTRKELSQLLDDTEDEIVERPSGSQETQNYDLVKKVKKDSRDAEDTSRQRGRPPKTPKVEQGTDDTDKKRGRPPKTPEKKTDEVFKKPPEEKQKPTTDESIANMKKAKETLTKLEEKNLQSTNEHFWHIKQLKTVVKEFNARTGYNIEIRKEGRVSKAYAPNGNEMTKSQMIKIIIEHNKKMNSQALKGMRHN